MAVRPFDEIKKEYNPKDDGCSDDFNEFDDKDYEEHLNGKKSIGIQPCDDEGLAIFGAIDIDPQEILLTSLIIIRMIGWQ